MTLHYGLGAYPAAVAGAIKAGCDARAGRLAEAELELARATPHLTATWHALRPRARPRGARGAPLRRRRDRRGGRTGARAGPGRLARRAAARGGAAGAVARRRGRSRTRPGHRRGCADGMPGGRRRGTAAGPAGVARRWRRGARRPLRGLGRGGRPGPLPGPRRVAADRTADVGGRRARAARRRRGRRSGRRRRSRPDPAHCLLDHPIAAVRGRAARRRRVVGAPGRRGAPGGARPRTPTPRSQRRRDPQRSGCGPTRRRCASRCSAPSRCDAAATRSRPRSGSAASRPGSRASCSCTAAPPSPRTCCSRRSGRDAGSATARRGLQVAISAARAVLDVPGACESRVDARERTYRLALRPDDVVDSDVFEQAAHAALAETRPGSSRDAPAAPRPCGAAIRCRRSATRAGRRPGGTASSTCRRELLATLAQSCLAAGDPFGARGRGAPARRARRAVRGRTPHADGRLRPRRAPRPRAAPVPRLPARARRRPRRRTRGADGRAAARDPRRRAGVRIA